MNTYTQSQCAHTRTIFTVASITLLSLIAIAGVQTQPANAVPLLPQQIYGVVTWDGKPLPENNLFMIADGKRILYRSVLSDGRFGYDPLILLPVSGSDDQGIDPGALLTFYVNGFETANLPFTPGSTTRKDIQLQTPVCGDRLCSTGEQCMSCPSECPCKDQDASAIPFKNAYLPEMKGKQIRISSEGKKHRVKVMDDAGQMLVEYIKDLVQEPLQPVDVQTGVKEQKRFLISKGVAGEKIFFLKKSGATNTVCAIDQDIVSEHDFTKDCSGPDEIRLLCDGKPKNGLTCKDLGDQFSIHGLKHSGVIEVITETIPPKSTEGGSPTPIPSVGTTGSQLVQQASTSGGSSGTSSGGSGVGGGLGGSFKRASGFQPSPQPTGSDQSKTTKLIPCQEQWSCSPFGSCTPDNSQARSCKDLNACGTFTLKPSLYRTCTFAPGTPIQPAPVPPLRTPPPSEVRITPEFIPSPSVNEKVEQTGGHPAQAQAPATPPSKAGSWIRTGLAIIVPLAVMLAIGIVWSLARLKKPKPVRQPPNQSLIYYIRQSRSVGYPDASIREALLRQGWSNNQVENSFQALRP